MEDTDFIYRHNCFVPNIFQFKITIKINKSVLMERNYSQMNLCFHFAIASLLVSAVSKYSFNISSVKCVLLNFVFLAEQTFKWRCQHQQCQFKMKSLSLHMALNQKKKKKQVYIFSNKKCFAYHKRPTIIDNNRSCQRFQLSSKIWAMQSFHS